MEFRLFHSLSLQNTIEWSSIVSLFYFSHLSKFILFCIFWRNFLSRTEIRQSDSSSFTSEASLLFLFPRSNIKHSLCPILRSIWLLCSSSQLSSVSLLLHPQLPAVISQCSVPCGFPHCGIGSFFAYFWGVWGPDKLLAPESPTVLLSSPFTPFSVVHRTAVGASFCVTVLSACDQLVILNLPGL